MGQFWSIFGFSVEAVDLNTQVSGYGIFGFEFARHLYTSLDEIAKKNSLYTSNTAHTDLLRHIKQFYSQPIAQLFAPSLGEKEQPTLVVNNVPAKEKRTISISFNFGCVTKKCVATQIQ